MGTPEFAVPSLNILFQKGYKIVGVVTAPDRPSGRGRKVIYSPVKEYALAHNLHLLQPTNLKDESFLNFLISLNSNLQIVVAFRMLPRSVWNMPEYGTINLHASLLPKYRGAAPINHAIINGEDITGLTTFYIDEKIDTGRIISQLEMKIKENETFGELHNRMKNKGASLIQETVDLIISGKHKTTRQDVFINPKLILNSAPKIFKNDCRIDWDMPVEKIHNLIRGVSPVPGAFTILNERNKKSVLKIFKSSIEISKETIESGKVITDQNTYLKVGVANGYLKILELQLEGKRKMSIEDFLRGYKLQDGSFVLQ